jgi:galactokinase
LCNPSWVGERLAAKGLRQQAAQQKANLFTRAARHLKSRDHSGSAEAMACFVPGRIEVLGKHTDYAGGRSLLATVERGFCTVARVRDDALIRVTDVSDGAQTEFEFNGDIVPRSGHWSNYPMTVARRLARNFPDARRGADIAFISDLPRDAGMSSSSALVVSTFFALETVNALGAMAEYTTHLARVEDLAGYLGTIENGLSFGSLAGDRGVGTFGGSEDHTAMLCARAGELVQYAYCPVRFERSVALPDDHLFVIGVSGVIADKTGSAMEKYNRVSRLAAAAIAVWREAMTRDDPHLAAAIASSPAAADEFRRLLAGARHPEYPVQALLDRLEQFIAENETIIPSVPDQILVPELPQFGEIVARSQTLGATLLQNQTPETVWLAERATSLGAAAASAFGAGFGGSVWALVSASASEALRKEWSDQYRNAFPAAASQAEFFVTGAGPAAFRL